MIIYNRGIFDPIKKIKLKLNDCDLYSEELLLQGEQLLKAVIETEMSDTYKLLTLLMNNYEHNLNYTIKNKIPTSEYQGIKFDCVHFNTILQERLSKIGINTHVITHKAAFFSTQYGDSIIREAHTTLVWLTKRNDKNYAVIFDPGWKISKPIGFYLTESTNAVKVFDNQIVFNYNAKDKIYPYEMVMSGSNIYSYNKEDKVMKTYFNPLLETVINPSFLMPISYYILLGYKALTNSIDINKRAYIKIMLISQIFDFYYKGVTYTYTFAELKEMKDTSNLNSLLTPVCNSLDKPIEEVMNTLFFTINHIEEFNKLLIPEVYTEASKLLLKK